ncbi:PH domain-containing protein [Planobispora rosea]|uniref:PH domain-containing protein n=1 Tax=Planobispora rosea TaxID=35762 RepID=UPI001E64D462|nr:PH domain-containing protein [Planobispora rosea]
MSGPPVPAPQVYGPPPAPPATPAVPAVPVAPVTPPLRLSPKVLLTDPIRMLPSLILPLAGVLFIGGFSPGSFLWAAFGIAGSVIYSAIRWATFTYQVVGDRLELTRALISRSVRTIPLERIRGVDVSTPPLHRLLDIAVLRIDTGAGGNDKQEGELDGVTAAEAERLKAVLLWHARARAGVPAGSGPGAAGAAGTVRGAAEAGTAPGAGEPAVTHYGTRGAGTPAPDRVFISVPRRWLVYGPLSGAYLLTPFALVAGAVGAAFQWGGELGLGERILWSAGEWLWDHPLLLAAAFALLLLAMPVIGVVMYAVFNWDFTLRSREGYLVAERGLLTRRSVSLERRRVRGFELVEGLVERRAGMARTWAIVTGLGDSQTRGQLLPVVPLPAALEVAGEAVGRIAADLRRHPAAARRRRLFRAISPWLVAAAGGLVAAVTEGSGFWWALVAAALLLAALGVPLGLDRYRSLGHAYDGSRLSVRSGSLRRSQAVVERRAVVGWTLSQTWFQRRAGLLTVTAGVGAGTGGYAAVDVGAAAGVDFVAEVTPDWLAPFVDGGTPA